MAVNPFQWTGVYKRTESTRSVHYTAELCYLCDGGLDRFDYLLCRDCVRDLPFLCRFCPVCALPGQTNAVCADCLNSKRLYVDRSVSAFRYEYPVNHLIRDLKFYARLPISGFFARMLTLMASASRIGLPELFLPVPLHGSRLAERGFNQSQLVAKRLSALTGVPVDNHYCQRIRRTRMQSGLSAAARRRNLKGAFVITGGRRKAPVHVAIVDDVVTTGTTTRELAKALASKGVERIDVWSCCRVG